MLSFKQLMEGMKELHGAVTSEFPHHEPIKVERVTHKGAVVSAFNRSVGRERVFHVLKKDGNDWKHTGHVRKSLYDANNLCEAATSKVVKIPTKKHGPHARRPVIKSAISILRRTRGIVNPTTLRNRSLLNTERQQHRGRLGGGHKNASASHTLARWNNPKNKWLEKGHV